MLAFNSGRAAERDFDAATVAALQSRGVRFLGTVIIPVITDRGLDFASGAIGYNVNDNGTQRVLRYAQVLARAAQ